MVEALHTNGEVRLLVVHMVGQKGDFDVLGAHGLSSHQAVVRDVASVLCLVDETRRVF
jgi:hypothetical protein